MVPKRLLDNRRDGRPRLGGRHVTAMRHASNFQQRVLAFVWRIPAGRVGTYAGLARALGRPHAARAVGNALHKNPQLIATPCHRVVRSNGVVGGYRQGTRKKATLLRAEGVNLDGHKKVLNFNRVCYQF